MEKALYKWFISLRERNIPVSGLMLKQKAINSQKSMDESSTFIARYNEKSDIYSFGILICELANGSEPYSEMTTTLMLTEKMKGTTPHLLDCTTILPDDDGHGDSAIKSLLHNQAKRKFSEGLHELAALCLQQEPSQRPTASQLLTHPYFRFNRKHMHLSEYLLPALPLSDKVAYNREDLESLENIRRMSDVEINTYEWDF
ncbi:serine/threonine-protein kinase ste20-like-related [Holotrichia oblita]|uniref:Serine/threonine-protein kinase ste20-like-related n=2 Tax=Holotrichia oblita TaxID=644536 RepID=A0ACB9TP25_HOLOL|nr:serine/threonine-protein kinase ste20-like-related [Holotrichia oblita]KAI4468560.1 serine/threonine-protein kinase ste20-like-related [Holotrichia oblita]